MPTINRAGASGASNGQPTGTGQVRERERDSSRSGGTLNSRQPPAPLPTAPASPAQAGRGRLERSVAMSREEMQRVVQQILPPAAEAGAHSRPEAIAGAAAPPAGASSTEAQANHILHQLISAGANLARVGMTIHSAMNGGAISISRAEQDILRQHFPDMPMRGIHPNSALGIALHRALEQHAASAPAQSPARSPARSPEATSSTASSSGGSHRSIFGRAARWILPHQRSSNTSPPRGNVIPTLDRAAIRQRGTNQSEAALQRLVQNGFSVVRMQTDIQNHLMRLTPLPANLRRALEDMGINQLNHSDSTLVDHPLLNFNMALHRHIRRLTETGSPMVDPAPRAAVPVPGPTVTRRPDGTRDVRLSQMPEREDHENNAAYGMRLLALNPGVRIRLIVSAFITESADRQAVIEEINACRAAPGAISSQFMQLRTISKADAGFRDAADHPEDATACMFGEELSLKNPEQQVIGLSKIPTNSSEPYKPGDELIFMDMKQLAKHLVATPRHPHTMRPLNAETIAQYAFRIAD